MLTLVNFDIINGNSWQTCVCSYEDNICALFHWWNGHRFGHLGDILIYVWCCVRRLYWQYAELPSSASDAVLWTVRICKMWDIQPTKKRKKSLFSELFEFVTYGCLGLFRMLISAFWSLNRVYFRPIRYIDCFFHSKPRSQGFLPFWYGEVFKYLCEGNTPWKRGCFTAIHYAKIFTFHLFFGSFVPDEYMIIFALFRHDDFCMSTVEIPWGLAAGNMNVSLLSSK